MFISLTCIPKKNYSETRHFYRLTDVHEFLKSNEAFDEMIFLKYRYSQFFST